MHNRLFLCKISNFVVFNLAEEVVIHISTDKFSKMPNFVKTVHFFYVFLLILFLREIFCRNFCKNLLKKVDKFKITILRENVQV